MEWSQSNLLTYIPFYKSAWVDDYILFRAHNWVMSYDKFLKSFCYGAKAGIHI